jgi:hypothetical protein
MRTSLAEYLRRLGDLESQRPLPGGDDARFQQVVRYREAVVGLSLAMVAQAAAAADDRACLDETIGAIRRDDDLNILFRIVMQCQIIDDVLDYSKDLAAGLPSFLTAMKPLAHAFERTRSSAIAYADAGQLAWSGERFALLLALALVSGCAKIVLALGRLCHRTGQWGPLASRRDRAAGRAGEAIDRLPC